MATADGELQVRTGQGMAPNRWIECFTTARLRQQSVHASAVMQRSAHNLRQSLSAEERDQLAQSTGPGASAFLNPSEGVVPIADVHFSVAVRRRLRMPILQAPAPQCQHRHASGGICGAAFMSPAEARPEVAMRPSGYAADNHCVSCNVGGGTVRRHNMVRDAVYEWLTKLEIKAAREQEVAQWNREGERAVLDITYRDPVGGLLYLDVAVVNGAVPQKRGLRASQAIARREQQKRLRYPGPSLVPFVLDTRGKWGSTALAWGAQVTRGLESKERAFAITECRALVSNALQQGVAEQLLSGMRRRTQAPEGPPTRRPRV